MTTENRQRSSGRRGRAGNSAQPPSDLQAEGSNDPQTQGTSNTARPEEPILPQSTEDSEASARERSAQLEREEAAIVRALEDIQREERITILRRRLDEAEQRRAAGFPSDQLSPDVALDPPHRSARGTSRTHSERDSSLSGGEATLKRRRKEEAQMSIVQPDTYKGKSRKTFTEFIRACEQVFETRPTQYRKDSARVLYARGFLRGDPQNAWYQHEKEHGKGQDTWEQFKDFLNARLRPAVLRHHDVGQAYRRARQGPEQRVTEFVTYLEELEAQLEPFTERQRCDQLLYGLRDELTQHVKQQLHEPSSYRELVDFVTKYEASLSKSKRKTEDRPKKWNKPDPRRTEDRNAGKGKDPPAAGNKDTAPERSEKADNPREGRRSPRSETICDYCKKIGHLEKDCRKKLRDEARRAAKGTAQST